MPHNAVLTQFVHKARTEDVRWMLLYCERQRAFLALSGDPDSCAVIYRLQRLKVRLC